MQRGLPSGPGEGRGRAGAAGVGNRAYEFTPFQPQGASGPEKPTNQALQPSARKHHGRGGDSVASRGAIGLYGRALEVRTIWLGGLGATWKADMQGVRI